MSERQQLERLLSNPNVRKMLDLIANAEGVKHGYNTVFGNQRFDNLQAHPNIRKGFTQTDGKKNYTTAAGRYQFLNSTWRGLAKQYGLRDFSAQSQDLGALALIAQKGALKNVVNGDYQGAVGKLGGTWASLPSSPYAQPKKTYAQLGLGGGPASQAPQPQGLTVQQLTAKYGKPKQVDSSIFGQQPQQPQGLTVQALTAKYGQPKAVDASIFGGQSQPAGLTVQELTSKYGAPKQVDLSTFGKV